MAPGAGGSAADMIAACFRRQTPEAFGGEEVPDALVPIELRVGLDSGPESSMPSLPLEAMGAPDAVPLDAPVIGLAGTYP